MLPHGYNILYEILLFSFVARQSCGSNLFLRKGKKVMALKVNLAIITI